MFRPDTATRYRETVFGEEQGVVFAMDMERQKRREEIQKAMGFIQSSLPFPEPDNYAAFLTQLVCNLLEEGNTVFRDGEWRQAAQNYSEGVNVARYAQAEALVIPPELLESLYVNRAAAHFQFGEFERGVQDCDGALCVCEGSRKALYRKALCLRELGRLREAYECGTRCLLTAPHDRQVGELAQDLANKLGLKVRKAYISSQVESSTSGRESNRENSSPTGEMSSNGLESLTDITSADLSSAQCIPAPLATPIPVSDEPSSPVATPCADLSESPSTGLPPMPYSVPVSEHMEEHMEECSVIPDDLDCISKKVSESQSPVQGAIPTNLPNTAVGLRPSYSSSLPAPSPQLPPAFFSSSVSQMPPLEPYPSLGQRDQTSTQALDALGAFSPGTGTGDTEGKGGVGIGGLDSLSEYTLPGEWMRHMNKGKNLSQLHPWGLQPQLHSHERPIGTNLSLLSRNPLAATHEFRQACHACYSRIGPRVMDYQRPHLKRVRPRPARNNFLGAFVLCKEVQERQECQYGENCTFAYCQEEIDVKCFDSKPRIISKRSKENLAVCSNLTARHPFDDNKCLVHVVRSANVRYSKVRARCTPSASLTCADMRFRYGCQREDSCSFAHSVIELKCWVLQQDTGITHEEMVQESKRHWYRLEQNAQRQKPMHVPHQSCSGGGWGGNRRWWRGRQPRGWRGLAPEEEEGEAEG
ncbi:hypothetical protein J4Q44_G00003330 [Coregonus suidteri]|uniref:Zinc finger CCCH domain-containing protein 7B-like n=1 Tax=Coregonus suidteri TaxID=861788 RepID=A0AAN8R6H2_9TELE